MTIRPYSPTDAEAIAAVYRDAVRGIGPQAYTAEQVAMWSSWPDHREEFAACLARGLTLVAQEEGRIVAFGQLEPVDHVVLLYCAPSHSRQGIATTIHAQLEAHAFAAGVNTLSTCASRISRPLFEKLGYEVVQIEKPVRDGIEFERFKMVKKTT